jgi:hypothetical protein
MNKANANILRTIELSRELLDAADHGDLAREDDGCGVLYAIVRDSAYKIIQIAEREKCRHIDKGVWDAPVTSAEGQQCTLENS